MKKILFLLAMLPMLAFISCSKDDEPAKDSLSGTTWTADYGRDEILVIEFVSSNNFQEYMADKQGNVASTGVDKGTYSYSDGKVVFTTHSSTSPFDYALISGNVLELKYKSGYSRTFMKNNK